MERADKHPLFSIKPSIFTPNSSILYQEMLIEYVMLLKFAKLSTDYTL